MNLPSPSIISYMWNFGSLCGVCLIIQILTGFLLAIYYTPEANIAFQRVIFISQNVDLGWTLRTLHSNGASFFFFCIYLHIGRNIYYNSFNLTITWYMGVLIFFITIITAFLGYVLPWGQISFWGATVITSLLTVIPYYGLEVVQWVWSGFSISRITLTRFFAIHFLIPFIITVIRCIHLIFLHQTGSTNPIGTPLNNDKIPFHPYFSWKDWTGIIVLIILLLEINLFFPYSLGDPDNFNIANPLVTPPHIQPEWYFLFAYAILRSIPNKRGGVLALIISIAVLFLLPLINNNKFKGMVFHPVLKIIFWFLVIRVFILRWIGAKPVEVPYIELGQIFTILYFRLYSVIALIKLICTNLLNRS